MAYCTFVQVNAQHLPCFNEKNRSDFAKQNILCLKLPRTGRNTMFKSDLHTHTNYSHAVNSVEEMVEAAKTKGLRYYGISEHSPRPEGYLYPNDYQESLIANYADYIADMRAARAASTENFNVMLGLEVDFMPDRADFARSSVEAYDFDYIIGGLHYQGTWGFDGDKKDWDILNEEERFKCYARYYADLATMSKSGLVDIVAHPDLIKMSSIESFKKWLTLPESLKCIADSFAQMRERDIILEISSAGLRKACNEIYPGPVVMKIGADLGLKICLSSDAHNTGDIAFAFDKLAEYAKSFGYKEGYTVIKREKHALPLG